jgi:hypothetical protein
MLSLTDVQLPETLVGHGLWAAVTGAVIALGGVVLWDCWRPRAPDSVHLAWAGLRSARYGLRSSWRCAAIAVRWHVARSPAGTVRR